VTLAERGNDRGERHFATQFVCKPGDDMAHYLVYYKKYWDDKKAGYRLTPYWTTNSKAFYKSVSPNDCIWVVASGDVGTEDIWYLLGQIQVSHPEPKPSITKWGKYHIVGAKKLTRFFLPDKSQPDFTAILWLLKFASGKRIRLTGRRIGQTLQSHGFRRLADSDASLLQEYARTLNPKKNRKY
jgi:hypothetical protein